MSIIPGKYFFVLLTNSPYAENIEIALNVILNLPMPKRLRADKFREV